MQKMKKKKNGKKKKLILALRILFGFRGILYIFIYLLNPKIMSLSFQKRIFFCLFVNQNQPSAKI